MVLLVGGKLQVWERIFPRFIALCIGEIYGVIIITTIMLVISIYLEFK